MILLQLMFEFCKTGLFAVGGGLATLPFLYEMAEKTGWFTNQDILNLIAISESTPGAIGINSGWFLERFDKILEEDAPFDVLAVMLGTNDILNSFQPDAAEAGRNMEAFLLHALNHPQIQGEGQKLFARKLFEALSE